MGDTCSSFGMKGDISGIPPRRAGVENRSNRCKGCETIGTDLGRAGDLAVHSGDTQRA